MSDSKHSSPGTSDSKEMHSSKRRLPFSSAPHDDHSKNYQRRVVVQNPVAQACQMSARECRYATIKYRVSAVEKSVHIGMQFGTWRAKKKPHVTGTNGSPSIIYVYNI